MAEFFHVKVRNTLGFTRIMGAMLEHLGWLSVLMLEISPGPPNTMNLHFGHIYPPISNLIFNSEIFLTGGCFNPSEVLISLKLRYVTFPHRSVFLLIWDKT